MNYFEIEIAKYQRRIQRIQENPNASMMASNRLFYQALLEHNIAQLKWWREGKPFISQLPPMMISRSFGDFHPLGLIAMADRLGMSQAETCVDKVRTMGLPDYACDRTILLLPLAVAGEDLPRPKIVLARTGSCEVIHDTHRTLARLLTIPVYTADIPFHDPHQEHLDYVVAQLKGMIDYVEVNLSGAKYNEKMLAEWHKLGRRWYAALHDIYELRKRIPCPDHPRDVFREPLFPGDYVNPESLVQYYESYRDELRTRAEKGFLPVGEERLRIVWSISGPYGSSVWDYLAKRGVSVPFWHYGAAQRNFIMPTYGDRLEFGKSLNPLEEEARMMLYNSWGGNGERWIRDTISACKDFKADGLVQFEQTGCQPIQGLPELVANRVAAELDIPTWRVEGRQLLGRSQRAEAEFMSGLEAFINLCLERKKG